MADLQTDVRYIKGVGEQRQKTLAKLGIFTLRDLVSYFPRDHEDRSRIRPIMEVPLEETACIRAMVTDTPQLHRVRRGTELVRLVAVDDSGAITITYFNQKYIKNQLKRGETYCFYGKISGTPLQRIMTNPIFEPAERDGVSTGRIVPVYRLTAGIRQKQLMNAIEQGLAACGDKLPDILPPEVQRKYDLADAGFAYRNIHFPADLPSLEKARRRLIFEELYTLFCAISLLRTRREVRSAAPMQKADPAEFYAALPFSPTGAQRRAVETAMADMCSGAQMNRLLQGDVGSGKTLVAAACIWFAWKNGMQSAFMAPTELLAEQHFHTLSQFLSPFGIRLVRLVGGMPAKEKRETLSALVLGMADVAVGTHALISETVQFARLGLVIADEQHRFGVAQRTALSAKGYSPHVLVMSATPIPRTLALIFYGDLDVSILDELPPGREPVDTFAVSSALRPRLYNFIRRLVGEGRQVYVVCPKVEEAEEETATPTSLRSAEAHARELREEFPDLRVALVHGKMKPREKDAVMAEFAAGQADILVATTVIEVGVDVPNAALMIVENAERFGLSQLHQLRGRVGRGKHKSYCVLVSDHKGTESRARLRILCQTNDGFRISEEDLRLRGPGDFFGARQHGLPALHIASSCNDMQLVVQAQQAAQETIARDPQLADPGLQPLRAQIRTMLEQDGPRN